MGPEGDAHFAPREEDVGVMKNFFGQRTDLVGEGQGLGEVFEAVFLLKMMAINDLPVVAELVLEGLQSVAREWRHAALAGFAFAFGEVAVFFVHFEFSVWACFAVWKP